MRLHALLVFAFLSTVITACFPSKRQAEWPIAGIRFRTDDSWRLQTSSTDRMLWRNADGDELTLLRFASAAELPPLDDIAAIRNYCRNLATDAGGGLISADVVHLSTSLAVQAIYKMERLPAYAYTGLILVPAGDSYFSIVLETVERGTTGARDAVVTAQLFEGGELSIEPPNPTEPDVPGKVKGWFVDPYDPDFTGNVLRSRSDEKQYDAVFPNHPLSKLRRWLPEIGQSITLSEM